MFLGVGFIDVGGWGVHHHGNLGGIYMDVSKNRGVSPKMDGLMENPIRMDDLGVPLFLETSIYMAL